MCADNISFQPYNQQPVNPVGVRGRSKHSNIMGEKVPTTERVKWRLQFYFSPTTNNQLTPSVSEKNVRTQILVEKVSGTERVKWRATTCQTVLGMVLGVHTI